jgi:hypothetical protein
MHVPSQGQSAHDILPDRLGENSAPPLLSAGELFNMDLEVLELRR